MRQGACRSRRKGTGAALPLALGRPDVQKSPLRSNPAAMSISHPAQQVGSSTHSPTDRLGSTWGHALLWRCVSHHVWPCEQESWSSMVSGAKVQVTGNGRGRTTARESWVPEVLRAEFRAGFFSKFRDACGPICGLSEPGKSCQHVQRADCCAYAIPHLQGRKYSALHSSACCAGLTYIAKVAPARHIPAPAQSKCP
jgi:hypothetical protein